MQPAVVRRCSIFIPTITKRSRIQQSQITVAVRSVVSLDHHGRRRHGCCTTGTLPRRQFTSQESPDPDCIEAKSILSLSSSAKEDNAEINETTTSAGIEQNLIATFPLDPDDNVAQPEDSIDATSQSKETINVNIPGRDSQVIMVSDNLIQMIQQNSELIMANMPSNNEPESNEPLIGAVPTIYYKRKETYFQFDYRNHPPITDNDTKNLILKIERALRNMHLEPIGSLDRGVETMKTNIENMKEGEDYRVSRKTYNKFGIFEPIKEVPPKTNRYTILKSLTERHALYATGNNPRFGSLKWIKLGQSFFGDDSAVEVRAKDAEIIIRDLWCYGTSSMFNGLQRRHFAMKRRQEDRKLKRTEEEEMKTLAYPGPLAKDIKTKGKIDLDTAEDNLPRSAIRQMLLRAQAKKIQ